MALPSSGDISFNAINVELGLTATAQVSLNDAAVRTLFGVSSGAISMSNGYGKANAFTATISTNQLKLNLRTWALANGWDGTVAATITIGTGVYIWSDSTSTPALTINGSWAGGLTLVNNGFVAGMGGSGAAGGVYNGNPGGVAISLGTSVTINNTNASAYIGGGGGGGVSVAGGGGGGAGGGAGGVGYSGGGYNSPGGSGGAPGAAGNNGSVSGFGAGGGAGGGGGGGLVSKGSISGGGGGGGGRIFPGAGGSGGNYSGSLGGNGGSSNNVGSNSPGGTFGMYYASNGGGGGGWGANGGNFNTYTGGTGGKAVALNGYSVTWTSGNTTRVYGAVS